MQREREISGFHELRNRDSHGAERRDVTIVLQDPAVDPREDPYRDRFARFSPRRDSQKIDTLVHDYLQFSDFARINYFISS